MAVLITITDAGRAEIINAENTGTAPVLIKTIQLGSGQYVPATNQTELQEPIKTLTTFGGAVVSDDTIHVNVEDDSTDEYTVYEFGLFTDKGTLFAVYSQEGDPISIKASVSTFLLAVDIVLKTLDADSVTFGDLVFVNPPASETVMGVVYIATQEEVNAGEDDTKAVTAKKLIQKITDFCKYYLKISNNLSEIKDSGATAQSSACTNINALNIDNDFSEIKTKGIDAQQAARSNLALGTSSTHDITTSASDTTTGRMLKVGDGGLLAMALSVTDANIANKDGLASMMFKQGGGSTDIRFGGYGVGEHLRYGPGGGSQELSGNLFIDSAGNLSVEWLAVSQTDGSIKVQHLQKLWGPLNKATAADVGALPLKTSVLNVDLNTLGAISSAGVYYQPGNAGATTDFHYPIQEAGSLLITPSAYGTQQEYTTFSSGRKFVRGLNGNFATNGPWRDWVEIPTITIADGRYQAKGSYTPTGTAYTKAESDARYQKINTASKASNGWFKDTNTGMIFQWGHNGSTVVGNATVTFPIAFPNACLNVQNTWVRSENNPGTKPWGFVSSFNNTSASITGDANGSYWFAIGY